MLAPLLSLFLAAVSLPPKPNHYVTDRANVLTADRVQAIDEKLKSFEQSTSDQIVVYIDRKVPEGTTVEEMAAQAFREWGIGQKDKKNGALVLLFTDDRKMRIEVGYGLEGSITDARSKLIMSTLMKPRLKEGDYAGAVDSAVTAMMNFARGEEYKGSGRTVAQANVAGNTHTIPASAPVVFVGLLAFFVIFVVVFGRKRGWVTGPGTSGWTDNSSSESSSSSSWSSSDSSSSDSGGDFSGGGGDSGGGGSSDSW